MALDTILNAGHDTAQAGLRPRERTISSLDIVAVLLLLAIAIATANFTTDRIVADLRDVFHVAPPYTGPGNYPYSGLGSSLFGAIVVGPTKNLLFTSSVALLLVPLALGATARTIVREYRWKRVLGVVAGLGLALLLISSITLRSWGWEYAQISIDPFMQAPHAMYRRLLLPTLANALRLSGVFYVVFYWALAFAAFILTDIYLVSRNVALGPLAWASLLTTGMFAAMLGHPGYPEVGVLALALFALIDFEARGRTGWVQVACFGLALVTHEIAALTAFGLLAVFRFGTGSWAPMALLVAFYFITWLANFHFDLSQAANHNLVIGDHSALGYFRSSPHLAALGIVAAYKVMLLVIVKWGAESWKAGDRRDTAFAIACVAVALPLDIMAVDFTRLTSFSMIGLVIALAATWNGLGIGLQRGLVAANLLVPSVYVGANTKLLYFPGLYAWVLDRLIPGSLALHPPL